MKYFLLPVALAATMLVLSSCQDDSSSPLSPRVEMGMAAPGLSYDVQPLQVDLPGALSPRAFGVNARGDVVGWYGLSSTEGTLYKGFLWSDGEFHPIQFPGALHSPARGINEQGDIVGSWSGPGPPKGFLLHQGEYTSIEVPGAAASYATDINSNGVIVGTWNDDGGAGHGFLLEDGVINSFDVDVEGATTTFAYGINTQGDVAGYYQHPDLGYGPYIRLADGTFLTDFDPPEPDARFFFLDISATGAIVGAYEWWDPDWGGGHVRYTSFVRDRHGTYTKLETSAARSMEAYAINSAGMVVGFGWSPSIIAFVAAPENPAGH
ncbi:MAG: hypothetical protein P8188_20000 [Gemmatimonadota bacterium]